MFHQTHQIPAISLICFSFEVDVAVIKMIIHGKSPYQPTVRRIQIQMRKVHSHVINGLSWLAHFAEFLKDFEDVHGRERKVAFETEVERFQKSSSRTSIL